MEPKDVGEQDTLTSGGAGGLRGEKGIEAKKGNHEKDGVDDSRSFVMSGTGNQEIQCPLRKLRVFKVSDRGRETERIYNLYKV